MQLRNRTRVANKPLHKMQFCKQVCERRLVAGSRDVTYALRSACMATQKLQTRCTRDVQQKRYGFAAAAKGVIFMRNARVHDDRYTLATSLQPRWQPQSGALREFTDNSDPCEQILTTRQVRALSCEESL